MRRTNYTIQPDNNLLRMLQDGDEYALSEIYRRIGNELLDYAIKRNVPINDCREIIQDIFLWLWINRNITRERQIDLRPYLYGMIKHKILRYFNQLKMRHKYTAELTLLSATLNDSTNEYCNFRDLLNAFAEGMQRLPDRCRQIFDLKHNKGLSVQAISEMLMITKPTVTNYIALARQSIRQTMHDFYNERKPMAKMRRKPETAHITSMLTINA